MPFSKSSEFHTDSYWKSHYENFLKPEIEKIPNVKVHQSAELRSDIIREIIKDLYTSEIIVADLTDYNPNAFWELGVRQSLKFGTVTIAEESTKLLFDIITKGTLFYNPDDTKRNKKFLQRLRDAIEDCIKNPGKSDSTVIDVINQIGETGSITDYRESHRKDFYQNQDIRFEEYLNPNLDGFYISIGFALIPLNNNNSIFDPEDPTDENLITSVYRDFNFSTPSGRIANFSKYLKNFKYFNRFFKSKFDYNSGDVYNSSEIDIFSNGNLWGNVIFQTKAGYEIISQPKYEFNEFSEEKYRSSPYIYHNTFPYLIIMTLLLAKLLYKDKVSGKFNFYARILSSYNISTDIYDYVKLSNGYDLKFEKLVNYLNLIKKNHLLKMY